MESSYYRQKLEGMSAAEILIEGFFITAKLMRGITKALENKKYERVFLLSQQVHKTLALLEVCLKEKEDSRVDGLIRFVSSAAIRFNQVIVRSDKELSTALEKSFKDLGAQYQKALEEYNAQKKELQPISQEKKTDMLI